MAQLILLKGLPYSGKTTWAKEWAAKKHNRIRLSWREIRRMQGGWNDRKHTDLAVYTALSLLRRALTEGYDVVLDEGNLYPAEFAPFLAMAQMMKKKVVVRVIQASPEVCKERCLAA